MIQKKIFTLFFFLCFSYSSFSYVVLIDPGHGGEELGAQGKIGKKIIYEKNLTLILSQKIRKYLPKNITSYLTRSFDRTVSLDARAELAEKVKADLFISVHFNSSKDASASGFEVYYLDNHDDVAIKKVEDVENKNVGGEEAVINKILIDLVIQKTVSSSKSLAQKVHAAISESSTHDFKQKDRGIKPGLFYVLALSKRPAILVEVGFLSNTSELTKMRRGVFLENYAKAIASGIENYIKTLPPKDIALF